MLIVTEMGKSGFLLVVSMKRGKHNYDYACETFHVNGCKISGKPILRFKVPVCMNDMETRCKQCTCMLNIYLFLYMLECMD
jgi:hypothetical protein